MKIGLVCPYNMARGGGVQEIVREMHRGLVARGHEVKIITPLPRDLNDLDITDMIFLGNGADIKSPMKTLPTISVSADPEVIEQVLEQENFDIIHFHEPWQPVLSRQILSRSKAINIATFHAAIPETVMSRTIIRVVAPYLTSILKYIHEYTAVSDAGAAYIRSLTDEPVEIIANGINLSRYKWHDRQIRPKGRKNILFVGRLEGRKGIRYLLKAFRLLEMRDPNVYLTIAGAGPDEEKLKQLAEDLQMVNYEFTGYISDDTKIKLMSQTDLFVAPAIYGESFGIVLLEAMASGSPVVAGNNVGYEDLMQGLGQLSVVNPRDDAEFARRMALLLEEPELRAVWLDWAKEFVKQYSYDTIIDEYEAFYKKSLKKHRA